MTEKHGSLSQKIPEREKILSVFATETVSTLFAFSFSALFSELCYVLMGDEVAWGDVAFPFWSITFFMLFTGMYYLFRIFVSDKASAVLSLLPALLLFFLGKDISVLPILLPSMIFGIALRLAIHFIPNRKKKLLYAALLLDVITLLFFFVGGEVGRLGVAEKMLCICLVALTFSAVQTYFYEKNKDPFPIYYFLIIAVITLVIPMKKDPINWNKVVDLGQKIAYRIETFASDVSYRFSSLFGESYTAGYSSIDSNGEKLEAGEKTQLVIHTKDQPYHTYIDEETGQKIKLRKTLYFAGGRGADREQLVRFINFLYENGVDRERVLEFTDISNIEVEYAYLNTKDIIAPAFTFLATEQDGQIKEGVSSKLHRKGYKINVKYLDIDYASPLFTEMLREERETSLLLSYDEAFDYVIRLFGIKFGDIMSREEYEAAVSNIKSGVGKEYLDVTGADSRLKDFAEEITEGAETDYDKCRMLEAYLRKYTYSTNAVGGYNSGSNMSTAEGMADIAQRFLFDTGKGYCVHYTSSMIMLLRLSGIPARATSGFRYAFPFTKSDEYEVSSSCAHVWPEAYIENVGWIPFEPTGAYYALSDHSWHRADAKANAENNAQYAGGTNPYESSDIPIYAGGVEEEEPVSKLLAFKVFLPTIVFTVILIIVLVAGIYLIKILRYKYGTPSRKLFYDVEQIKRVLIKRSGNNLKDRGLLSEFKEAAPEELREDLGKVFDVFYRVVYGTGDNTAPTPEENALASEMRKKLIELGGRG